MDFSSLRSERSTTSWNQLRVSILSKLFEEGFTSSKRYWLSGILLFLSLWIGHSANQLSENKAIENWEKSHLPPQKIVQFSFQSYGWKEIKDPKKIQKIIRTLPAALDENGSFWVSSPLDWIIFFSDHKNLETIEVYCHTCQNTPQSWSFYGKGWRAFEGIISKMDQVARSFKPAVVKKPIQKADPRAWTY